MALEWLKCHLPKNFKHGIVNFCEYGKLKNYSAIPDDDPVKAIPFDCTLRVNFTNAAEAKEWKNLFENSINCKFSVAKTYPKSKRNPQFCVDYQCHHSDRNKCVKSTDQRISMGTGRKYKATGCRATMKIRIKRDTVNTSKKDPWVRVGLLGIVRLYHRHNHNFPNPLQLVDNKNVGPCKNAKKMFMEYFKGGLTEKGALDRYSQETDSDTREAISLEQLNGWYSEFQEERNLQFLHRQWNKRISNDTQITDVDSNSEADEPASPDPHVPKRKRKVSLDVNREDFEGIIDQIVDNFGTLKRQEPSEELMMALNKLMEVTETMAKCRKTKLPIFIDRLASKGSARFTAIPKTVKSISTRKCT